MAEKAVGREGDDKHRQKGDGGCEGGKVGIAYKKSRWDERWWGAWCVADGEWTAVSFECGKGNR